MKYIKNKLLVITLLMIATITPISSIGSKKTIITTKLDLDVQNQSACPWITIWVHGTLLTPKFMFKKFFHVKPGLSKARTLALDFHHRTIAETLSKHDTQQFDVNNFYLFGWSGKLCFKERKKAAQELHKSINACVAQYQEQYGVIPRVRVITHSHGGNVALNMAQCSPQETLCIDELILLACPVQEQTKHLIGHNIFKSVYSLYSKRDLLQVIDPQGIYGGEFETDFFERSWFSSRLFPAHSKLKQAEITYNGRGILHVEFLLVNKTANFIEQLPEVIKVMANSNQPHQEICLAFKNKK